MKRPHFFYVTKASTNGVELERFRVREPLGVEPITRLSIVRSTPSLLSGPWYHLLLLQNLYSAQKITNYPDVPFSNYLQKILTSSPIS